MRLNRANSLVLTGLASVPALCVPVVEAFKTGEGSAVTWNPVTGEATAGKPEARETAAANDLKVLFVASYYQRLE